MPTRERSNKMITEVEGVILQRLNETVREEFGILDHLPKHANLTEIGAWCRKNRLGMQITIDPTFSPNITVHVRKQA